MKKFLLIAALCVLSVNADAKEWQVDSEHSTLSFTGDQSGEKFTGGFKKFTAQIDFDPTHPETGKINVTVDTGSAFAGSKDRDDMLPEKIWFDSAIFPQATFTSTGIKKTGDGQFEAAATLSIKGITKNVTLPFTLVAEGDHYRAQGSTTLMRNDFNLGMGMFTGENYVKNAVTVSVDIVAKPKAN